MASTAKKRALSLESCEPVKAGGYVVEGFSVSGWSTCVMIPSMKIAFDIGSCPQRAVLQDFVLISHSHMDHIGGIATYVLSRGLQSTKLPTVIVPSSLKPTVEKLLDVYRELDQGAELKVRIVGLDVGQELAMGNGYFVKPFRTYHVVPSQGYLVYTEKKKLKPEYADLPGAQIRELKCAGVEVSQVITSPEVAFTGDTTAEFIQDPDNEDVLKAKLLIMDATFLDGGSSVEKAREYGHVHLSEIVTLSDRFRNEAILLIHFNARYTAKDISAALQGLPEQLQNRVQALTNGF